MDTHCPACLTSAWGGEKGFTAGSALGSTLPVLLSSTVTAHSQNGPTTPKVRSAGRSLSTPHPANPDLHSARPVLLISPLPPHGPTASPQAGDCPRPPVAPGFHHSHQRGGISLQQLHLLHWCIQHRNPTSHRTTNIWRGGGSWMWVCFASQAPARRSQHELG